MEDRLVPGNLALVVKDPPDTPTGYIYRDCVVEIRRYLFKTHRYSAILIYGSRDNGKEIIFPSNCLVPAVVVPVADHGHEAAHKLVNAFLAERRESEDGGWAPVEKGDISQLHAVIDALITAKWGTDADGDRPVQWELVDRTRYWPLTCEPVPYLDTFGAPRALRTMLANLKRNVAPVDTQMHLIERDLLDD